MMRAAVLLLVGCVTAPEPPSVPPPPVADVDAPLPGASLYHLDVDLVDQHGEPVGLDVHRGHPAIVSMFYASCPTACPMLIQDVKALEARLPPDVLADTRVLLVSLDPERDDPAALAEVVRTHGLDDTRWTLARAELDDVRTIAAALDVRFRPLPDGEMNHSSLIIALDRDGVIVAKVEGLRQDPGPIVAALSGA